MYELKTENEIFAKIVLQLAALKEPALLTSHSALGILAKSRKPKLLLFIYLKAVGVSVIEHHIANFHIPSFLDDLYQHANQLSNPQLQLARKYIASDLIVAACLECTSFPHHSMIDWRKGLSATRLDLDSMITYFQYFNKIIENNPSRATKKCLVGSAYKVVVDILSTHVDVIKESDDDKISA